MQRSHYTRTLNVDVENCRELLLADMIEDRASATLFFSKYCEEALKAHWDVAHLAKWKLDMSGASASQSIGFRNTDMIVIFAPHYVGSHAIGRALVEIPFNAASRFLTDRIIELWIGPHRNTDPI
jgi:hypothetical protein